MNDEIENVVTETTENTVEQPVEDVAEGIELTDTADVEEKPTEENEEDSKPSGRFVSDEELNEIVNRRVARKMSKLEKDYESKMADYRDIEAVLNTGLGTKDIKEANRQMRQYYESEGIKMPEPIKPGNSKYEIEVLARDEAERIIEEGMDSMVSEANRLAQKGYQNMNDREKIIFTTLGDKITEERDKKALLSLGAKEELLKDEKFLDFRKQFKSNVPMKDIYSLYKTNQPKPKVDNPGSMKSTPVNEVKNFYTDEEISKLSLDDLDKPGVYEAVRKSMTSQK